jgi:hypothetical protein
MSDCKPCSTPVDT